MSWLCPLSAVTNVPLALTIPVSSPSMLTPDSVQLIVIVLSKVTPEMRSSSPWTSSGSSLASADVSTGSSVVSITSLWQLTRAAARMRVVSTRFIIFGFSSAEKNNFLAKLRAIYEKKPAVAAAGLK